MSDTANLYEKNYFCKTADGNIELPVSSTGTMTYITDAMASDYQQGAFFIRFLNAAGAEVTPTGGTVDIDFKPIDTWDQWHQIVDAAGDRMTIMANTVGQMATYVVPIVCLPFQRGRVVLANIAGATTAQAVFWKGITG